MLPRRCRPLSRSLEIFLNRSTCLNNVQDKEFADMKCAECGRDDGWIIGCICQDQEDSESALLACSATECGGDYQCERWQEETRLLHHDESGKGGLFNTFKFCPWCGLPRAW